MDWLHAQVKGPRDRLSEQQRAWLAALAAAGLQVEVLKVRGPKGASCASVRICHSMSRTGWLVRLAACATT